MLAVHRLENEDWREAVERIAKKFGLEQEALEVYDSEVFKGADDADAAFAACYEWDICEYVEDHSSSPPIPAPFETDTEIPLVVGALVDPEPILELLDEDFEPILDDDEPTFDIELNDLAREGPVVPIVDAPKLDLVGLMAAVIFGIPLTALYAALYSGDQMPPDRG